MLSKLIKALTDFGIAQYPENDINEVLTFIEDHADDFAEVLYEAVEAHNKWQEGDEETCEECGEILEDCACEECDDCGSTPCICK